MPYMTQMKNGQHCVYKKGADDQPEGESLGCHASEAEAMQQLQALQAKEQDMPMMEMIQDGQRLISELSKAEFRGGYPDIPLPSDIDVSALGENPMFVTLPVAKVGKSANGYSYTLKAIHRIAEQINTNRNEGRWGHLKPENRATEYPPPAVRWLAATVADDGTLWAKCVPTQEQAREHFRVAKAANAGVGISIYGMGTFEKGQVVDFDLESVDLGDPARVGIKDAVARPRITAEMIDEKENAVDEQTTQRIAELTQARDTAQVRIAELTQTVDTQTVLLAELCQAVGIEKADTLKAVVAELVTARNDAVSKARKAIVEKVVLAELAKLPTTAKQVLKAIGTPSTDDETAIKTLVSELMTDPDIQEIAEMERVKIGGPRAFVGHSNSTQVGKARVDDETVQAAHSLFG